MASISKNHMPPNFWSGKWKPYDLYLITLHPFQSFELDNMNVLQEIESSFLNRDCDRGLTKIIRLLKEKKSKNFINVRTVKNLTNFFNKIGVLFSKDTLKEITCDELRKEFMSGNTKSYNYDLWLSFSIGFHQKSMLEENNYDYCFFSFLINHNVFIEKNSHLIKTLLVKNDLNGAMIAILQNPIISIYFLGAKLCSKEINCDISHEEFEIMRFFAFNRLIISQVALLEFWATSKSIKIPSIVNLLEGKEGFIVFGKNLLQAIYKSLSIRTHNEFMLFLAQKNDTYSEIISESTLKRWSSGEEFPSHEKIQSILRLVGSDDLTRSIEILYWAANRFRIAAGNINWICGIEKELLRNSRSRRVLNFYEKNSIINIKKEYGNWLSHWNATQPSFQLPHELIEEWPAYLLSH